LKLAISGQFFHTENTGSGQYTRLLTRELSYLWDGEIRVFVPSAADNKGKAVRGQSSDDNLRANSNVKITPLDVPAGKRLGKLWFEQISLPLAARAFGADLLHVPYFGPPLFSPCPVVATVHDLIAMAWPGIRPSASMKLYNWLAGLGAKRARLLIADSKYTKSDIISHLKIPEERVFVVYLGAPSGLPTIDENTLDAVLSKYSLAREGYILYVGGLDKRKNVPALLTAFAGAEVKETLALAGEAHSLNKENFPDLTKVVDLSKYQKRIKFLGWVSEEDKPFLYGGAAFFVYPSEYEGFGLPPLEAMAWGAPVVCSSATSLPEVTGDAALTFEPGDVIGLQHNIERLSGDAALREELKSRGRERARLFSWRSTAEQTLKVYGEALRERGHLVPST